MFIVWSCGKLNNVPLEQRADFILYIFFINKFIYYYHAVFILFPIILIGEYGFILYIRRGLSILIPVMIILMKFLILFNCNLTNTVPKAHRNKHNNASVPNFA